MTRRLLAGLVLAAVLPGCTPTTGVTTPPTATAPAPADAVTLREVTVEGFQKALAEQKGKVVLIDVWFLGCAPCVKKFPSFVALHAKYAGEGVTGISLDIMASEVAKKDRVQDFLAKQNATFPNFIFNDTEAAIDAWMDRYQAIPTPATVVYNRKGEYVKTLTEATPEQIEAAVKEQLAAKLFGEPPA